MIEEAMAKKNIWLIDATTYHRALDPSLEKLKDQYFKIKAHVRKARLGAEANPHTPKKGYSIGLLRIQYILRNLSTPDCEVKYLPLDTAEEWVEKLARNEVDRPDIIGFSAVTPTVPICARMALKVRETDKDIRLVLGGAHARVAPQLTKTTLVENGAGIFDDVISSSDGKAVAELLNISEDNIPSSREYLEYNQIKLSDACINIFTRMGCQYRCAYCQDQLNDFDETILPPDIFKLWFRRTCEQIKSALVTKDPYPVHFCDSEFGGSVERAIELCEMIESNFSDHGLLLSCDLRAEFINKNHGELIESLWNAGFREIRMGLDSADDKVVRGLKRTATPNIVLEAVRKIREYGCPRDNGEARRMYVSLYIITGLPGSTRESDGLTQRFVTDLLERHEIDEVKHHLYVPYPCDPCEGYSIPSDVRLEHESDWRQWENYDRQSEPVYSLLNYSKKAIWSQFLQTELEINKAWIRAWPTCKYFGNNQRYGEYNVFSYFEQKPEGLKSKESVSILYLTDLHLANTDGDSMGDTKTALAAFKVGKYSELFREQLNRLPEKPDFVVVGGDITFCGTDSGFLEFNNLVKDMMDDQKFAQDQRRILMVPGNHDVNNATRFQGFNQAFRGRYTMPPLASSDHILKMDDNGLSALINDAAQTDGVIGGWIKEISIPFILDVKKRILLYGFNSAMASRSDIAMPDEIRDVVNTNIVNKASLVDSQGYCVDPACIIRDELKLFEALMDRVLPSFFRVHYPNVEFDRILKVAVFHHPVALLPTYTEVKEFGYFLNAGEVKKELYGRGFRMIFHGHNHWPEVYVESAVSGGGAFLVISGGAICDRIPEQNPCERGFYWIKCYPAKLSVEYQYIELTKSIDSGMPVKKREQIPDLAKPRTPSGFTELATHAAHWLLCEKLRRGAANELGWAHNLNDNSIETVGTAYGLLVMSLLETHSVLFLEKKADILRTLSIRHLTNSSRGWAQSKPKGAEQKIGRPDITAWVLEALHAWDQGDLVQEGLRDLQNLLDDATCRQALNQYVYTLSVILRVISKIDPGSPRIRWLSDSLIARAKLDDHGTIKYWCNSDPNPKPSVIHTAHAIIALLCAHHATGGGYGLDVSCLSEAAQWLHDQDSWEVQQETIAFRSRNRDQPDELAVWHYTIPWAIKALLDMGFNAHDDRIEDAIGEMLDDQHPGEKGLWDLRHDGTVLKELPVWATYDALSALQSYERANHGARHQK